MDYSILPGEPLSKAAQRIANEQIAEALFELQRKEKPEQGIHQARKNFKQLRGLARLFRDDLGKKPYRAQNVYYRDLGRSLSTLRDATALIESLHAVRDQYKSAVRPEVFKKPEAFLIRDRERIRESQIQQEHQVEQVIQLLEKSGDLVAALNFPVSEKGIVKSIKRVYKRGYKAYNNCSQKQPDLDELHEWRKRVKYLWYHHLLLKDVWEPVFAGFAVEIHKLSDLLGNYRDLGLLEGKLAEENSGINPTKLSVIQALIREHQTSLLDRAQSLGTKIYAEKPGKFAKRIKTYFKVWRSANGH